MMLRVAADSEEPAVAVVLLVTTVGVAPDGYAVAADAPPSTRAAPAMLAMVIVVSFLNSTPFV